VRVFPRGVHDEPAKDTLGDEVEDGVRDGLGSNAHLIGALSEDPDDGVEAPSEDSEVADDLVVVEEPDVREPVAVFDHVHVMSLAPFVVVARAVLPEKASRRVVQAVVESLVAELADVVQNGNEGEDGEAVVDPLFAAVKVEATRPDAIMRTSEKKRKVQISSGALPK